MDRPEADPDEYRYRGVRYAYRQLDMWALEAAVAAARDLFADVYPSLYKWLIEYRWKVPSWLRDPPDHVPVGSMVLETHGEAVEIASRDSAVPHVTMDGVELYQVFWHDIGMMYEIWEQYLDRGNGARKLNPIFAIARVMSQGRSQPMWNAETESWDATGELTAARLHLPASLRDAVDAKVTLDRQIYASSVSWLSQAGYYFDRVYMGGVQANRVLDLYFELRQDALRILRWRYDYSIQDEVPVTESILVDVRQQPAIAAWDEEAREMLDKYDAAHKREREIEYHRSLHRRVAAASAAGGAPPGGGNASGSYALLGNQRRRLRAHREVGTRHLVLPSLTRSLHGALGDGSRGGAPSAYYMARMAQAAGRRHDVDDDEGAGQASGSFLQYLGPVGWLVDRFI